MDGLGISALRDETTVLRRRVEMLESRLKSQGAPIALHVQSEAPAAPDGTESLRGFLALPEEERALLMGFPNAPQGERAMLLRILNLPANERTVLTNTLYLILSNGSLPFVQAWRPGTYYSPLPSMNDIRKAEARIFNRDKKDLPGINMREPEQLALLKELSRFCAEMPYTPSVPPGLRYKYPNLSFNIEDTVLLYSMIRHARPRRIIEVGSGYTSALMLDTNELFFDNRIQCTFIEPYPDVLNEVLRPADREQARIIGKPVQDVPVEVFQELEADDILFTDCSHVSKIGSDVNYLFLEVFPQLRKGVFVHVHDVFYPFEYPEGWVYQGWAWNEDYMLRAFLEFNSAFEIVFFSEFMGRFNNAAVNAALPLYKSVGGSLWLRKVS